MTWLLIGLGNPGPDYAATRHNAGFMVVEQLRTLLKGPDWKTAAKTKAVVSTANYHKHKLILAQPHTYMNESGLAVAALMQYYKVPIDHVIVVVDDVDLPFETLRVRGGGSPGTHNGLRSISQHIGNDYMRVRVGVAPMTPIKDLAGYVLRAFPKNDQTKLSTILTAASDACLSLITAGVPMTMNRFNKKIRL